MVRFLRRGSRLVEDDLLRVKPFAMAEPTDSPKSGRQLFRHVPASVSGDSAAPKDEALQALSLQASTKGDGKYPPAGDSLTVLCSWIWPSAFMRSPLDNHIAPRKHQKSHVWILFQRLEETPEFLTPTGGRCCSTRKSLTALRRQDARHQPASAY